MWVEDRSLWFCILWIECIEVVGTQWNPRKNKASGIPVLITLNFIFSSVSLLNCSFVVKHSLNIVSQLRIFTNFPLPWKSEMFQFRLSRTLLHGPTSKPIYLKAITSFDQLFRGHEWKCDEQLVTAQAVVNNCLINSCCLIMEASLQVIHQQVFKGKGILDAYNSLLFFQNPPVSETVVESRKWELANRRLDMKLKCSLFK